jgi:hypothetical protein
MVLIPDPSRMSFIALSSKSPNSIRMSVDLFAILLTLLSASDLASGVYPSKFLPATILAYSETSFFDAIYFFRIRYLRI